jgi:hypothetical protein
MIIGGNYTIYRIDKNWNFHNSCDCYVEKIEFEWLVSDRIDDAHMPLLQYKKRNRKIVNYFWNS